MKVSVVIIAHNEAEFLTDAILSVEAQTYTDWELVCVSDGSTDDTGKIMKDSGHLFLSRQKGGPALARNTGFEQAKGEFFVPLDGDDMLDRTYLQKTVEKMSIYDVAYTDIRAFGMFDAEWRMGPMDLAVLSSENVMPCCAMFKREVWEAHPYDSETEMFCDWDFWLAAVKNGYRGVRIPEALWYYRRHPNAWTIKDQAEDNPRLIEILRRKHADPTDTGE